MQAKNKLTEKVQYPDGIEATLTDEQIRLVNMLADEEPTCYLEIADIIIRELKRCS